MNYSKIGVQFALTLLIIELSENVGMSGFFM